MTNKYKEQFTVPEYKRLNEIAKKVLGTNIFEGVSGDENVERLRFPGNTGIEKVGGSILRYMLETIVRVVGLYESERKAKEYWRDKAGAGHEAGKEVTNKIVKACDSAVKEGDCQACVNIIGNLLHHEDELYI